ncbi:hypothetical protein ElyMa_005442200 [Elysia marginata]|uniref:Uncharacterized protein n=1 Tax=Elysia marginata TaxID=1093978 RepID=A0AAV4EMQ9_9GAST|nr:hypothetical protein ElyMa_005442200 [Elysia marginata]
MIESLNRECSVFSNDTTAFDLLIGNVPSRFPGVQHKYIRVASTLPLDVQFFLWTQHYRVATASLVLEQLSSGTPTAFFVDQEQRDNSLG